MIYQYAINIRENKIAYVIKITDLTGEGKPDLYYAEPRDMRRALVADINQAKKYATEDEAYDEIDDSDVAELVIDYGIILGNQIQRVMQMMQIMFLGMRLIL